MIAKPHSLATQATLLYERYGRPLEREHAGQYVAIFPDGRTVLGATPHEALDKAVATIGPGSFVFKLDERTVWRWRCASRG